MFVIHLLSILLYGLFGVSLGLIILGYGYFKQEKLWENWRKDNEDDLK